MVQSTKSTTMKDVAKLAGVSTATVSRAFSHPERLAISTRLRVEEAIISCGYTIQPSPFHPEKRLILVLVNSLQNPLDSNLMQSIRETAAEQHYLLMIHHYNANNPTLNQLELFAALKQICGIIQIGTSVSEHWLNHYFSHHIPRVMIGCNDYSPLAVTIDVDHLATAFNSVNSLCLSGYSRIAYIGSAHNSTIYHYHQQGYQQALQRWQIAYEKCYTLCVDTSLSAGQQAAETLMSLPSPPHAIYCNHDLLAVGVLHHLKQLNLMIPHDIAVISFGNLELCQFTEPKLTSGTYPTTEIGKLAVTTLLSWLANSLRKPAIPLLDSEIIQRDTTK